MSNTPYVDIIFGQYEPDWGGLPRREMPGYLVDAVNVRSTPNGYRCLAVFSTITNATQAGITLNPLAFNANNGTNNCFFVINANDGTIVENRAEGTGTWETVTPTGTAPTSAIGMDFLQFGGDAIIVCGARAPISKDLSAAHATDFAALSGSPPVATCGAVVHRFVVLGCLTASDIYAVRWCAIGNHEDWPTPGTADARSKQAGSESLSQEYGRVMAVLRGEKFGIIMQERALTRMTYVGGSAVFDFATYETQFGLSRTTLCKPCTDGKFWYWINDHGLFATDGYSIRNLSDGRIEESLFIDSISHADALTAGYPASAFDPKRSLAMFMVTAESAPACNVLTYNAADGSLGFFDNSGSSVAVAIFNGFPSATSSERFVYNYYTTEQKLQKNTGSSINVIAMQTGFIEIDPGYNVQIQGAHLLGTGTGDLTLEYKTAATSAACDIAQTGFSSLTAAGLGQKKTARATAQYAAFRVTGNGSESQLIRGIRVYYNRAQPAT